MPVISYEIYPQVLKALALLRMGRRKESFALTEEVVVVKPTDEATLSALSICFREMQKRKQSLTMWQWHKQIVKFKKKSWN